MNSTQDVLVSVAVHSAAALFIAAGNSSSHSSGIHGVAAELCADTFKTCRLLERAVCSKEKENCSQAITALIFPFFALAIGCVLQPLSKYIKQLPYTLFLLFSGFIIGLIGCRADLGMLNTSLRQWIHLDPPNLFFYIFLAPLIFEAAFVTQWHIFKRLLIPILTAAFVIVILQVGLIGAFTMGVIEKGKGWNWWSALMFGAMLSATDPISVTATLKSLGASENLGTLIEGESLVNDGSAFVLWETFFHNTEHLGDPDKMFSVPKIIAVIAKSAIGGMALGILFAVVTLGFLTYVYDEFEVETSLTLVVAFLGFWTAQSPAVMSGVICNVASGLVLSAYGRPLISKSVRHPLAEFWELLGWAANTIVFIHAGVLTVAFVWPCENAPFSLRDYFLIIAFFLFLQVIRVGLFMFFLPVLSFKNKWFTWKEDLLVGLSGLRGAVSLILALNVAGASPIPVHVRSRVFLWTTGVVALSLIVNGLMIPFLLAWLGLDGADKTREDFLSRARATMTQATLTTLDALCVDISFKGARWSYVLDSVMPSKWLEDDEFGHHYASAAEQLQSNAVSHRLSLEFMSTEHRRASTHADLRLRTSTEMLQSAPDSHQPSRLSLSHAPAGLRAPDYTNNEKMATSAPRPTKAGSMRHAMPPLLSAMPDSRPASSLNLAPRWEPSHQRRSIEYDVMRYDSGQNTQKWSKKIQSELAALHGKQIDANFHEEDDSDSDSSQDREIRRRMLMNMLTHVRHLSNATLIEYNALVNLEEVIQQALDANDESREYDLFSVLERKSYFVSVLSSKLFSKLVDEKQVSGESVVIASIVFQIMSEILKQPGLQRSRKVVNEAKNLYEGASYLLTRLETYNFKAYRWVLSQFAIHAVIAKQDAALSDMLHGGVIDAYEHKVLNRELLDIRRRHAVHPRSIWKKQLRTPNELVSAHPLFSDNLPGFLELTRQPTVSLAAGHRLRLESGTLVVVMKGGLQPVGRTPVAGASDPVNSTSATSDSGTFGNGAGSQKDSPGAGSTHYWAYPAFSGFLGPELTCSINNEPGSEECSVVKNRLAEVQFIASDISTETVVYTLPNALVRQTAFESKQFRDEVTRFMARGLVLDTINDQEPHHLRLINEALANKVEETTVLGRAYRILERLPYMSVVRLHAGEKVGGSDAGPSQTTINGPGVLLNGVVRVSVVDTSGLTGATNLLHERLEGPALLPADQLIIQEVAHFTENGSDGGGRSEIQGSDRTSRRADGLGPVLANVLIVEHTTIDQTARARLKRWRADADSVDMNGRFGMYRQISNDARRDAASQQAPRSTANISRRSFGESMPGSPRGDEFV